MMLTPRTYRVRGKVRCPDGAVADQKDRGFWERDNRIHRLIPRAFSFSNMAVTVIWPRVLGIPIPISLEFLASPLGDAQNADRFDFA